ncbi:girdin-like protein [Euroglyphus maynei]|uniref:Girdin-like protein n=1 Tax=Euroglyphus maynei TaxID=6958 RepID=A0A1Y3B5E8_EURMA|nr:girdin-like protein [Euroglyphus maynei]
MLKSSQPGVGGVVPPPTTTNGSANSNLGHPPTATTPQTPPETPETNSPSSVGPPQSMLSTPGGNGQSQQPGSLGSTNLSSSLSSTVSPPSAMSPPITSWDMNPAKTAMANSYIPQYSWYHHGHDQQLLT